MTTKFRIGRSLKTLGSGKIGVKEVFAETQCKAVKICFINDARLYISAFGRDRARELIFDSVYFIL